MQTKLCDDGFRQFCFFCVQYWWIWLTRLSLFQKFPPTLLLQAEAQDLLKTDPAAEFRIVVAWTCTSHNKCCFPDTISRRCCRLLAWPWARKSLIWSWREPTDGCPILNISQLSMSTSMLIQVLGNNTQPGLFVPFVFLFSCHVQAFPGDLGIKLTHISSRCFGSMSGASSVLFSQEFMWWAPDQSRLTQGRLMEEDEQLLQPEGGSLLQDSNFLD